MVSPLGPIALLLASAATAHASAHWAPARQVSHVAGWTLRVTVDRFTAQRGCRLTRKTIGYERQALVFHLRRRVDTSAAVYRIDGGPVIAARSDEAELTRLGFLLHDDNLDNPSDGLVRIPEVRLAGAGSVRIEPAPYARPITFDLSGFATARAAALTAGCAADAFGVAKP